MLHLLRRTFLQPPGTRAVSSKVRSKRKIDKRLGLNQPPWPGNGSAAFAKGRFNLFDVAASLPKWGRDMTFAKKNWRNDRYYTLKRINLKNSGNHGKAWGVFHENGAVKTGRIVRIGGGNKRKWMVTEKPKPEPVPWITVSDLEPERVERKRRKKLRYYAKIKGLKRERWLRRHESDNPSAPEEPPQVPA